MLIVIRIIFVSLIMSLLLVTSSIAGIILYGMVRMDNYAGDSYINFDDTSHFPLSLYRFRPKVYDLKYDNSVPLEDRVKNLYKFILILNAHLTLVSFDKITGVSKFKLTLQGGDWLTYDRLNVRYLETGGVPLKDGGSLKLEDGSEPLFIIEGKMKMINEKPTWFSFNRNKYFDIEIANAFDYAVRLKLLHDFPVMITSKS